MADTITFTLPDYKDPITLPRDKVAAFREFYDQRKAQADPQTQLLQSRGYKIESQNPQEYVLSNKDGDRYRVDKSTWGTAANWAERNRFPKLAQAASQVAGLPNQINQALGLNDQVSPQMDFSRNVNRDIVNTVAGIPSQIAASAMNIPNEASFAASQPGQYAGEVGSQVWDQLSAPYKPSNYDFRQAPLSSTLLALQGAAPFLGLADLASTGKKSLVKTLNEKNVPQTIFQKATGLLDNKDFTEILKNDPQRANEMISGFLQGLPGGKDLPGAAASKLASTGAELQTAEENAPPITGRQLKSALSKQMGTTAQSQRLAAGYPEKVQAGYQWAMDRINKMAENPEVTGENFSTGVPPNTEIPPDEVLNNIYKQDKSLAMQKLQIPELNEAQIQNTEAFRKSGGADTMTPKQNANLDVGGVTKPSKFPTFKQWKDQYISDLQDSRTPETYNDKVYPNRLLGEAKRDFDARVAPSFDTNTSPLSSEEKIGTRALADTIRQAQRDASGSDQIQNLNEQHNNLRVLDESLKKQDLKNQKGNLPLPVRTSIPLVGGVTHGVLGVLGGIAAEESLNSVLGPISKKLSMNSQTTFAKGLYNAAQKGEVMNGYNTGPLKYLLGLGVANSTNETNRR